jgi:GT2 family glycosyltransferase
MILAALMTCHNRRAKTLASLDSYFRCELPAGMARKLVLVDDGSTDGTAQAVASAFPEVIIEHGDGNLFWNRGMLHAWQHALPLAPDYVLWLNDDTRLYPHALARLLDTDAWSRSHVGQAGIIVGSTENDAGKLSYGGSIPASRFNRLKMNKVMPGDRPKPAITLNGNCVLVPREVFEHIGLLDGVFPHAMGDNDYGFRAHKAGVPIWVMPGYAGHCNVDHHVIGSFNDRSLPLPVRWKKILSTKGVPIGPWKTMCKRHAGALWPVVVLWPYGKLILTSLIRRKGSAG